jgi:hypothetical protein
MIIGACTSRQDRSILSRFGCKIKVSALLRVLSAKFNLEIKNSFSGLRQKSGVEKLENLF